MTFKAYDKREDAKKQNFHATPELLSRLVADKVKEYNLPHQTVLDNSIGSGQLVQFVPFEHIYAYEIDENAREFARVNFGDKLTFLGTNALLEEDYPISVDCVIANPPFSIKKAWSSDEDKANVLAYLNRKEREKSGEVTLF